VDPHRLRPYKARIAEQIAECGLQPKRILEYGCNYADLLQHYATAAEGAECFGVEASAKAIEFARKSYGDEVKLYQGTIARNEINDDAAYRGYFDLVIVDDVFCWVSRETLYESIANIDDVLQDGGFLYIREFYPQANRRNVNHHVSDEPIFCFKPAGPHHRVFTASGIYAIVWQKVTTDRADSWARERGRDPFDSRWVDTILRKSLTEFFD
jgi:SAM-dependent methyltransferase